MVIDIMEGDLKGQFNILTEKIIELENHTILLWVCPFEHYIIY